MFFNWSKYGIEIPSGRTHGQIRTLCPKCSASRHKSYEKCLSVNLNTGTYHCWNGDCDFVGFVGEMDEFEKQERKEQWKKAHQNKKQTETVVYKLPTKIGSNEYTAEFLEYCTGKRCISEATLKAMKVTEGYEYMPQAQKEKKVIEFNYFLDGIHVNTKFRTLEKEFKGVTGAHLVPYNIDAIKYTDECIITEGEFDTLSFCEIGLLNAVSVPSGAKNTAWIDEFIDDYFANKKTIYIAGDTDAVGVEMKDELIRRFGAERCKIITYKGYKDANELLMKEGKGALMQAYEDAQDAPIGGVFSVNDLKSDLDALYEKGWQRGVTIGLNNFDNLCSFEVGRVCIVTGIPTSGKSEFVDYMTVMLNRRYGWKTVYFSPENFPITYHIAKLSEKIVGKPFSKERENRMSREEYEVAAQYINDNFFFIYPNDNCQVDNILEKAQAYVRRKGCKIVVLDPYNRLDHDTGSERETVYISKFLDKLTYFAQQNGVLVILVAHPTKLPKNKDGNYDPPTLYDISGSSAFYAKADFGITIHRDKMEMCVLAIANKVKFKHLGDIGTAKLQYNINNGRYVDYEFGTSINWDNSNFLSDMMPKKEVEEYSIPANAGNESVGFFKPNLSFEQPQTPFVEPIQYDDDEFYMEQYRGEEVPF